MDPFTEKLLERTRARRENLQKKLAERPNAPNRSTPKRPLADTNSVITEPAVDKVPQLSSKPSPSKRKCSEENVQPAAGEENQEPMVTQPAVSLIPDPATDKKPPMVPTSIRTSSSLERTATRPAVQSQSGQLKTTEPEKMAVSTSPYPPRSVDLELVSASSAPHKNKEDLMEDPAPPTTGMRSRLQMLADQRKGWDGSDTSDAVQDYAPLSLLKRQAEGPPTTVPSTSSDAPVGRKGRLANLAATIGSWEDDLSHANNPKANTKEKPGTNVPKFPVTDSKMSASTKPSAAGRIMAASAASGSAASNSSQATCSSVKSNRVAPQKEEIPVTSSAPKSVTSSQKSSTQGTVFPSSPQKVNLPSPTPVSQSPLKNQVLSRGLNLTSSPQKAMLPTSTSVPRSPLKNQGLSRGLDLTSSPQKPNLSSKPVPQSPLKDPGLSKGLNLISSPQKPELHGKPNLGGPSVLQDKSTAGTPGVKSFLERFGERCQERSKLGSPAGVQTKTPGVATSVTPNTRLVQERIRAAQSANTTTADLTQRQKMERESELAMIRNRFQKGNNVGTNKQEAEENNKITDIKEQLDKPVEADETSCEPLGKKTAPSSKNTESPMKGPHSGLEVMVSPPASTSSPLKTVVIKPDETREEEEEEEEEERVTEVEMNVDQSINSDVINELFDGILEQSEDQSDEEEEEDALNISSMSLLTPLAETVASVVRSPARMMTSTPESSFIVKSNTPESSARRSKFQRANVMRAASSESVEASDEDHKLPYSIDAYRSTRVKETERPNVKQVIVRKEDVSHRVDEPRGPGAFNVKQKIKMLSNELNLQQTVIHQASQALNCCTDEEHGKGSQVEAEAERLLLVATERREALRAELDRLKGDPTGQKKASEVSGMSASKGSIIVQELRLPLKADFVCSTANKPEATKYSFFIMIRAGAENTVATTLASTHRGLSGDTLTFPTKFIKSDVPSNFEIDIEVYGLVQKREFSGDKKKKPSKSKAITPKRFLAITKSVQTPVVASPGGPNAVRTSNFVLVGSHKLTLSSIGEKKFPLEKMKYEGELLRAMFQTKVPFLCPLEGHIYLKMQCEVGSKVEERGFLTMFEDVSGFGAWHRRWCVLSGYCISYWTYPDDEKRKNPIGRINLANCTSKKVDPANREFCARANTFELITVRPQREDDKETLVSLCQNTMCVTKNWLSADTKDERNLWMKKLNQILVDLRMWQPDSCIRPQ